MLGERLELVDTATLAACDIHGRFAEHCPGPVVATSDGGLVGSESVDESGDDDSTDSAESDRLAPRVREHIEQHDSSAHGHDHAPDL